MCRFLSSIYTRPGDLICDPEKGDSHEDLIAAAGLRDSGREFVRLEFYPPTNEQLADLDAYVLHLDEESAPDWWDEGAKEKAERKLRVQLKKIILTESVDQINGGCAILGPGVAVKEARGTRIVHQANGSSVKLMNEDGSKVWYKNGQVHRDGGPAVEWVGGRKDWYKNGQFHREDGPAREWPNGAKFWYKDGQLHREDGPASEGADGYKAWYKNGQFIK